MGLSAHGIDPGAKRGWRHHCPAWISRCAPSKAQVGKMTRPSLPYTETYRFPGCRVRLDSAGKYVLSDLARVYEHCRNMGPPPSKPTFVIRRSRGGLRLTRNGAGGPHQGIVLKRGRVMPFLEREINQYLVDRLGGRLLVHAAAVSWHGLAIILPATTRGGKSTLAAGLIQRGCGYLTDELAITDRRTNKIVPFPKSLSLKEGSFSLFESLAPEPTGYEHDRVWYVDPERLRPGSVVNKPVPIGWVVFPWYQVNAATRIEALTIGETVLGLFENTVNIARHKEAGLDRLIGIAQNAHGYRLVFGDHQEACKAVLELVEGNGQSCG